MLVKCDQSLHSSFLWCRFYQVCVTYWELCQVWILVYSSRVYSSLTGVSCLWSKQCKGRRYLERTAATLLCVKCALAHICVKCVYSRIWCAHFASRFYSRATVHVATDYTTLSLFWNWSYFLSLPKKTVIPQMKTSPATFLFLCFFFLFFSLQMSIVLSPCQLHQIRLTFTTCRNGVLSMISLFFVLRRELLWLPHYVTLAKNSTNLRWNPLIFLDIDNSILLTLLFFIDPGNEVVSVFLSHQPFPALRALSQCFALLLLSCLLFVFLLRSRIQVLFTIKKEVQLVSAAAATYSYTNVWVLIQKTIFLRLQKSQRKD